MDQTWLEKADKSAAARTAAHAAGIALQQLVRANANRAVVVGLGRALVDIYAALQGLESVDEPTADVEVVTGVRSTVSFLGEGVSAMSAAQTSKPSGGRGPDAAIAAALTDKVELTGQGDVVIVVSGRNVDDARFSEWVVAD